MKKFIFSKSLFAFLVIALIAASPVAVNAQRATLGGDWKLDESKSELGQFGGRTSRTLKVEQKEDAITITRVTPGFNGGDPVTSTLTLTFDGKVVESEGFGGSKRKSTAKWSDDGKTLVISSVTNFERDGQSFEFKATETWSVAADGSLSVVTNSTSPRGDMTVKAIYTK